MAGNANFCTWNSLHGIKNDGSFGITYTEGNTKATQTHNGISTTGTMAVKSGKWYWEIRYAASADFNDGHLLAGWQSLAKEVNYAYTVQQPGGGLGAPDRFTWGSHLINWRGGGTGAFGGGYLSSINNVNGTYSGAFNLGLRVGEASTLQFAGDFDNNDLYFGVNNTWYDLAAGTNSTSNTDISQVTGWPIEAAWRGNFWTPACWFAGAASGTDARINCGQDSTFAGLLTATSNADENGFGEFAYSPPSGYLALCSANLPIDTNIDPAQDVSPNKYFDTILYTGDGGTNTSITSLSFQPDWLLIKNRDVDDEWLNQNSVSGVGKTHAWNDDGPYVDETDCVKSFNSDGWTMSNDHKVNENTSKYVAYCWKKSADSGFDIVEYSGNGTTNNVSHSLGAAPDCIMMHLKSGSDVDSTMYFNSASMGTGKGVFMTLANAAQSTQYMAATSGTTFTPDSSMNSDGRVYVAYLFRSIEGFSRFGEFEGNADANGIFVYTGFRPKFVFVKAIDASENWQIRDTARAPVNVGTALRIYWNTNGVEGSSTASPIDFLANGFKVRGSNTEINANTLIYGAWGDVPFKYNNAF